MQGPDFILFITDPLGWSYYTDANGMVQRQFQPRPLQSVPSNFSEMELKWGRSSTYAGLQQTYSIAGQFVQDAAKIIRHIVYNQGSEGIIKLRIYKLNKEFGAGLQQELFYESEFDLSKYDRQREFTASMLMEGGAEKIVKAFEGTDFEIDVTDDPEAIDVLTDGLLFKNVFNYKVLPYNIPQNNDYFIPVVYLNRDGITDANILSSTENYEPIDLGVDPDQLTRGTNWMFKLMQPGGFTFRVKGSIKFTNNAGVNKNFGISFTDSSGFDHYITSVTSYAPGTHEITFDFTITPSLLIVRELSFFFKNIIGQDSFSLLETDITISFDFVYKWSLTKALPGLVLVKRLFKKILGYEPAISSSLLTDATDIVFSCGDAVRGLPSSKIKTSFAKLFRFLHMRHCAGFDLLKDANGNAIVVIEKRIDFYKDEEALNAGDAEMSDHIAEELLFNEIIIGYPDQDYGEVNGRGEFNCTQKYTTPIQRTVQQLDLQTAYRADMYGIEITRINLQNKTTTDSSSDNDTFVFHIEKTPTEDGIYSPDPFYKYDRSVNASATGLIHAPSAFNIQLSPKSCLLNHGWYLRSCLYFQTAGKVKYQTSDKNANLSYTNGAVTITEKEDIIIGALPAAVWQPFILQITPQAPVSMVSVLTGKPKGWVRFTYNGITWKGWIIDAGTKPVTLEEQQWKLICKADNNMTTLI